MGFSILNFQIFFICFPTFCFFSRLLSVACLSESTRQQKSFWSVALIYSTSSTELGVTYLEAVHRTAQLSR